MSVRTAFAALCTPFVVALALMAASGASSPARAQDNPQPKVLDKVVFGTNWLAQGEHGGFYQALADGTYKRYGLDVTIRQGGPQGANRALLLAGKVDFYLGGGMMQAFDSVRQDVPTVTVASLFQRNPGALLVHPDQGIETFADVAKLPTVFLSKEGYVAIFGWLKSLGLGFRDEQYKPYAFNPGPFIADKRSAQQGYVTSEPYAVEQQGGFKPKAFLFDDMGFKAYSTTIEAMQATVDGRADMVQRFVDATIIGWYNYIYGDNRAANELIKKDNPEMTDGQLAYSLAQMKAYGIVVSGDAETKGVGCMTDERMKSYFDKLVAVKLFEPTLDFKKAYTTRFVCKGVGLDLRK